MNKRQYLLLLKATVLLAPLPLGCVGSFQSAILFLALLLPLLPIMGRPGAGEPDAVVESGHGLFAGRFFYPRAIGYAFAGLLLVLALQVVPLPLFLLRLVSPRTVQILSVLKEAPPAFHPVSLVPFKTLAFIAQVCAAALFFLVLARVRLDKRDIVSLLKVSVLSGLLQALLGLSGLRHGRLFSAGILTGGADGGGFVGCFSHPQHLAFYLVMIWPLTIALILFQSRYFETFLPLFALARMLVRKPREYGLFLAAAAVIAGGILLSRSMPGLFTLLFAMLLLFAMVYYLTRTRPVRRHLKPLFVAGAVLVGFLALRGTIQDAFRVQDDKLPHFLVWPNPVAMMSDFPFLGTGLKTLDEGPVAVNPRESSLHSGTPQNYLEFGAEGGLLGMSAFYLFAGVVLLSLFRTWRLRRHPDVKALGLGLIVSLFAAVFFSPASFSFLVPAILFQFALMLALAVKVVTYKRAAGGGAGLPAGSAAPVAGKADA